MISLDKVSKSYGYQGHRIEVLAEISLAISSGECVCLRAPSGKGKTTLLNIIGGMLAPSSGRVEVAGQPLTELPQHFLADFRRDTVGFIFQQFNLLPHFTVLENLYFPLVPSGISLAQVQPQLEKLLARLQISHRRDFAAIRLSGGEQQRVAVARALVNDPLLIIADEPFSNLDPENSGYIMDIFTELKDLGKTIVISSTAPPSPEEDRLVDRDIWLAEQGREFPPC